jgi:hypothetical protein
MPSHPTPTRPPSTTSSDPALKPLDRLVGAWATEATHPALPGAVVHGSADVEWLEGERFLILRTRTDHPDFPDAISIIGLMDRDRIGPPPSAGADADAAAGAPRLCMHYFDSRGVFRVYEAGIDDSAWQLARPAPGFSQRFTGTFADGGDTIVGLWQLSRDDVHWEDDVRITFRRRGSSRAA